MTLDYDQTADALYIRLREGADVERTEQLDGGTLLDLDRRGALVGIELIHPARAWALEDVLERFEVAEQDAEVLRSLWGQDRAYPFATPELVLA
jgi:uncharacterized protein YuzE